MIRLHRGVGRRLDEIATTLARIERGEATIMSALDDLRASVSRITQQDQAIIALCSGLSQQLKDALAAGDTAAIEEIANQLGAEADQVAAAVASNTPAAAPGA